MLEQTFTYKGTPNDLVDIQNTIFKVRYKMSAFFRRIVALGGGLLTYISITMGEGTITPPSIFGAALFISCGVIPELHLMQASNRYITPGYITIRLSIEGVTTTLSNGEQRFDEWQSFTVVLQNAKGVLLSCPETEVWMPLRVFEDRDEMLRIRDHCRKYIGGKN